MFYSLARVYSEDKDGVVILDATHVSTHLRVDKTRDLKPLFDEIDLVMWNIDKSVVSGQNLQREYPIAPEVLDQFYAIFELPTEEDKKYFDKICVVTNNDIAQVIKELNLNFSK